MLIDQYWLARSPNNWHIANIWVFNTFMANCQFNQLYAGNFPHLTFSHSIFYKSIIYINENEPFKTKWASDAMKIVKSTRRKRFEIANKRYQPKKLLRTKQYAVKRLIGLIIIFQLIPINFFFIVNSVSLFISFHEMRSFRLIEFLG